MSRRFCPSISALPIAAFVAIGLTATGLTDRQAFAAAAVATDQKMGVYSYEVQENLPDAIEKAEANCKSAGGTTCEAVTTCSLPGFGAVAHSAAVGTFSSSCGAESEERAIAEAVANCNFRALDPSGCEVLATFEDTNPSAGVNQSYFSGKWAHRCGSYEWYRFDFKSANEIIMEACNGSEESCKPLNAVFGPSGSEQVFVYPNNNQKLVKRGPDTLEWRGVDTEILRRCKE
ncbi:MAG: hypothetical protein AAF530_08740 [Pseudomonadota bacterium]